MTVRRLRVIVLIVGRVRRGMTVRRLRVIVLIVGRVRRGMTVRRLRVIVLIAELAPVAFAPVGRGPIGLLEPAATVPRHAAEALSVTPIEVPVRIDQPVRVRPDGRRGRRETVRGRMAIARVLGPTPADLAARVGGRATAAPRPAVDPALAVHQPVASRARQN
jgi:hypothetical protein